VEGGKVLAVTKGRAWLLLKFATKTNRKKRSDEYEYHYYE
jgi:hypothetical protein